MGTFTRIVIEVHVLGWGQLLTGYQVHDFAQGVPDDLIVGVTHTCGVIQQVVIDDAAGDNSAEGVDVLELTEAQQTGIVYQGAGDRKSVV